MLSDTMQVLSNSSMSSIGWSSSSEDEDFELVEKPDALDAEQRLARSLAAYQPLVVAFRSARDAKIVARRQLLQRVATASRELNDRLNSVGESSIVEWLERDECRPLDAVFARSCALLVRVMPTIESYGDRDLIDEACRCGRRLMLLLRAHQPTTRSLHDLTVFSNAATPPPLYSDLNCLAELDNTKKSLSIVNKVVRTNTEPQHSALVESFGSPPREKLVGLIDHLKRWRKFLTLRFNCFTTIKHEKLPRTIETKQVIEARLGLNLIDEEFATLHNYFRQRFFSTLKLCARHRHFDLLRTAFADALAESVKSTFLDECAADGPIGAAVYGLLDERLSVVEADIQYLHSLLDEFCQAPLTSVRLEARVPSLMWQKCALFVDFNRLQLEAARAGVAAADTKTAADWTSWLSTVGESGSTAALVDTPPLPAVDGRREHQLIASLDSETAAIIELADETNAVIEEQRDYITLISQMHTIELE